MKNPFRKKMTDTNVNEAAEEKQTANNETVGQEQASATNTENEAVTEEKPEPTEEEKIAAAQNEAGEWKDKYMRLHAEFDNFRKRTQRERLEMLKSAGSDVIKDMLPIVDDFDRAVKANQENKDIDAVIDGFELIQNKLIHTLKSKGLEPMDSMGKVFDVDLHEGITNIPAPSEDLKGKVVDVIEKGYTLNDKVIRYAKVVIGQ